MKNSEIFLGITRKFFKFAKYLDNTRKKFLEISEEHPLLQPCKIF